MLTAERKNLLLDRLRADGRLVSTDLARDLCTSEDTIRRDLRDLAAEGLLTRIHGGALPASPTNRPLAQRVAMRTGEKDRLGRSAANLVRSGQIVLIDGGTTHLALMAALPENLVATIVTHCPGVAAAAERLSGVDVVLLGGTLLRHSMVAMGPETVEGYARVRADLCFLGVTGLHPEAGLTTGHPGEAALKARMIRSAGDCVVLATADKIGTTSPWTIAPLGAASVLVSLSSRPDWLPENARHMGE